MTSTHLYLVGHRLDCRPFFKNSKIANELIISVLFQILLNLIEEPTVLELEILEPLIQTSDIIYKKSSKLDSLG